MSSDLNRTALITCAREIMTAPAGRDVISILLHHVFFFFFFLITDGLIDFTIHSLKFDV